LNNLLDLCGITLDDLRELYEKERSIFRVQKYLGVSRPTVTKWLAIAGVKTLGHRPLAKPTISMAGEYGAVTKWIQEHPGEKLPKSIKLAAEKVGCSERAMRSYLYRRARRTERYLRSLGDLKKMHLVLETVNGRNVSTAFINQYQYKFNARTYIVKITFRVASTNFQSQYPLKVFLTKVREQSTVEA